MTALGLLAAFMIVGPAVGALVLAGTLEVWQPWLQAHGALAFLVVAALLAGLSLIPTHAVALVAGFESGAAVGSSLALVAILVGAWLGFVVFRGLAGRRLIEAIATRPRARVVHEALVTADARRTVVLIALLRLSPLMPFAATNLLMAASGVRRSVFLTGSVFGMAPRVIAVAVAGAAVSELTLGGPGADPVLIAIGVAATLIALFAIGVVARRALRRSLDQGVPMRAVVVGDGALLRAGSARRSESPSSVSCRPPADCR